MSFINPFFLYFLPLAGIPILIHLIGRKRYHKQEFSTLRFLKQLEVDLIRKLKIRQLLLLILRVLLIGIIILIFSRPYSATRTPGTYIAKGQTLYLMLDNSLSMQGKSRGYTVLESGRTVLLSAIRQIDFPIYLKLIKTTNPQRIEDFGLIYNPDELTGIINNVPPSNQSGQMDFALLRIIKELQISDEVSSTVWIISDFQESDWQSHLYAIHPADQLLEKTDSRLVAFPIQPGIDNLSLSSLSIPDQIIQKDQSIQLQGFVRNWTTTARDASISLHLDDRKLGQALLSIQPRDENNIRFEFILQSTGYYQGLLKLPDDDLLADNQRYFFIEIPEQIKVLIVTHHPEDGQNIQRAVDIGGLSLIDTKQSSLTLLPTEDLEQYDLIVFSNVDQLPASIIRKLSLYFELRKSIIVFPGSDCKPDRFNRLWNQEFGFPKWRTMQNAQSGQYLKIGRIKGIHPLFKQMFRENESIDYSPEFYSVPGFSTGKDQEVLATFEDQTPLLIEVSIKGSRGMLVAAAPVAGWSNLHLTGFFPALMNRLVYYLSQPGYGEKQYITGDTLRINPVEVNLMDDISIRTADKRILKLIPGKGEFILFDETEYPGFYDVFAGGQQVKSFVVNIPESESSWKFLSAEYFEELINRHPARVDIFYPNRNNDLMQLQQNREFSDWLIILAIGLALAESIIGRTNRKLWKRD